MSPFRFVVLLILLMIPLSVFSRTASTGEEVLDPSTVDLKALAPEDFETMLTDKTSVEKLTSNPTWNPEFSTHILPEFIKHLPPDKLDVTKIPVDNQKALTKDQLLYKSPDGKPNFERLNLNDLSPSVRDAVLKSAGRLAPTEELKVTPANDPVQAKQTKDGVQLTGKISELKQGDALARDVENVKITPNGMSFSAVPRVPESSKTSIPRTPATSPWQGHVRGDSGPSQPSPAPGSSSMSTLPRGNDELLPAPSRSPSRDGSVDDKQLILTLGNLQTFADNLTQKTMVDITKNPDGTYTITTTNAITKTDLGDSVEYLIGERSTARVHPREGILQTFLDSPGRYIREYKDFGPSILGAYPKGKTFARSFSIARSRGLQPYEVAIDKPGNPARAIPSISDHELILPGIITYLRQGFYIKSEEFFNNTAIVDIQHTDDLYHPIVESLDDENVVHIILDSEQLFSDINVTVSSTPASNQPLIAHFEDMMMYQVWTNSTQAGIGAKQLGAGNALLMTFSTNPRKPYHYSRFEHATTPAVINTLAFTHYPGVFQRKGDRISIAMPNSTTTFLSLGDGSGTTLQQSITAYNNHMRCTQLDNRTTIIPANTAIIEMSDNKSRIRNIGWKYWLKIV
ncbi:hypothetical protein HY641_00060 [Candidatus Woesearchaeota archaeon]|nr:hypothetical protein [Candidatus Woesearchaeota archaeon]